MSAPRLGLSYFGNRYLKHARADLEAIVQSGASIVDHVMSEEDLRWNPSTIAELITASKDLGLETWLAPWGLGGVFGGEAASYAVMESPNQCQRDNHGDHLPALCFNQPAIRDVFVAWLDAAAVARVDVVTWDEPHLALPAPKHTGDRWACRCNTCQEQFHQQFGRAMPLVWDDDTRSFSQKTVDGTLAFLVNEARGRGIDSAVIFLPEDDLDEQLWGEIATRPGVRYFGVSPYWMLQNIPVDEFEPWLRRWCRQVVKATQGASAQSLAWLQAFSVPAGREPELRLGMDILQDEGIQTICAWSYQACVAMSGLRPANPDAVWSAVTDGFSALSKAR